MNEQLYHPIKTTLHWKDRSSASDPTIRQTKDKDQTCRKKKRNAGDLQEAEHHKLTDAEARREEEAQNMKGGNFRDCGEEESHKKGNPGADAAGLCCSLLLFTDTDGTERKSCFYRKGEGHQRRLFGRFFFTACHYFLPFLIYRFIGRSVSFL